MLGGLEGGMAVLVNSAPLIFVYGTLMRKIPRGMGHLLAPSEFLGDGWIQARLFSLGHYPGAVLSNNPSERVLGELHRLLDPEPTLARMDEYEGCEDRRPESSEYRRVRLSVTLLSKEGQVHEAWVYIYNHDTQGLRPIPNGDYLSYAIAASRNSGDGL